MLQSHNQDHWPMPLLYVIAFLSGCASAVFFSSTNGSGFLLLNELASFVPDWFWANVTVSADTLFAVAVILALAGKHHSIFTKGLVLLILGSLVSQGAKHFFDVPRPAAILPHDTFEIIGPVLTKHAFPSGHSFTAFACWTLVALHVSRRWLPPLMAIAALAAFSRIAVGAHWPLDTLVGSALGILVALFSVWLVRLLPGLDNAWVRGFSALLLTLATAYFPFFDTRYPDTQGLAILISLIGLTSALAFYWYPLIKNLKAKRPTGVNHG